MNNIVQAYTGNCVGRKVRYASDLKEIEPLYNDEQVATLYDERKPTKRASQ